jgi:hypothetical protein
MPQKYKERRNSTLPDNFATDEALNGLIVEHYTT